MLPLRRTSRLLELLRVNPEVPLTLNLTENRRLYPTKTDLKRHLDAS